jgi:lipoprotein-releasing system permease protein
VKLVPFIAKRLLRSKESGRQLSRPIVNISVITIAVSLGVMLLSHSIVNGFKDGVFKKLTGISAHIRITALSNNLSYETSPIPLYAPWINKIAKHPDVLHIQPFATKLIILNTGTEIQGALIKGINHEFDTLHFRQYIQSGHLPLTRENQLMLSKSMANQLQLSIHDSVEVFYLKNSQAGSRIMQICGIFHTGVEEIDRGLIYGTLSALQGMYEWKDEMVSGFEIMVNNLNQIPEIVADIEPDLPLDLLPVTIQEEFPEIFYWLPSLDQNAFIIIGLMFIVSLLSMSTTLLILIFERTHTIGVFKTLGMTNRVIRKIFEYQAFYIILRGIFWGNAWALGFLYCQSTFKWVKLDETQYYLSEVPVSWLPLDFLALNVSVIIVSMAVLIIPGLWVSKLNPVTAIKMD